MKNNLLSSLLLSAILFFTGCATVDSPDIRVIEEKPTISKTVQQQRAQAGKAKGLKRKVAIARFSNETRYGQSFFLDDKNDRIGKQAVDILSSTLLETEKFILLERADLGKLDEELALGNYAPLKNMADYLVVGSITEFGRKNQGEVGIFSRTKRQIAFAKVHIRLIDVRTGQVLHTEEGAGEAFSEAGSIFGVGERAGYDSAINDKALAAAITNLASNLIENLLDRPWRSYILGIEAGQLMIAGGRSQNIQPGARFQVIREGKTIRNPQTNMPIILPGQKIAEIKALASIGDSPESEITFCELVQGDLTDYLQANDFSALFIQENQ